MYSNVILLNSVKSVHSLLNFGPMCGSQWEPKLISLNEEEDFHIDSNNRLGPYASNPGNTACCYSELSVSSPAVAVTIASTHCAYQTTSELWWLSGGKRGDYQTCSVLYCVLKLCTVISTLRWAVLTVLWIEFCLTRHFTVHRFICVYLCVFSVFLFHTA